MHRSEDYNPDPETEAQLLANSQGAADLVHILEEADLRLVESREEQLGADPIDSGEE